MGGGHPPLIIFWETLIFESGKGEPLQHPSNSSGAWKEEGFEAHIFHLLTL